MRTRGQERREQRRSRLGECNRKARYATAELACDALSMLRADGKERGEQHAYECPHGGPRHWHVGRA